MAHFLPEILRLVPVALAVLFVLFVLSPGSGTSSSSPTLRASPRNRTDLGWNRLVHPDRHVVVCEDDLGHQTRMAAHLNNVFEPQGRVQFSFVLGALAAAAIMCSLPVDLVILDHDMPNGNGQTLIHWMASTGRQNVPVVTFSGLAHNNDHMMSFGRDSGMTSMHMFCKNDVVDGHADEVIRTLLGL
jgi:CheY-like chemotaxis protein